MKKIMLSLVLIPALCFSQYKSSDDTIIITTVKQRDCRNYINSFLTIPESKNNCSKRSFPVYKCIPDTLDSISIFISTIDSKQAFYQCYKNGLMNDKAYLDTMLSRHDTTGCSPKFINTYVAVLTGLGKNGKLYYIPETTNNFSFCDEKAYELKKTFGFRDTTCIKHTIIYEKVRGNEVVLDSTYVSVNRSPLEIKTKEIQFKDSIRLKYLSLKAYESRHGEFTLNKKTYKLAYTSSGGSYSSGLLLFYTDIIDFSKQQYGYRIGNYVHLNDVSYHIASVKDNGEKVILIKGKMPSLGKKPITTIRGSSL